MDIKRALSDLNKTLQEEQDVFATVADKLSKLAAKREKIINWLENCNETADSVPELVKSEYPILAWRIMPKTDASCIETQMYVDDYLIPQINNKHKLELAPLEDGLKDIGEHMLVTLKERGVTGTKLSGVGSVSLRTDSKYNIADKVQFVKWAVSQKCEAELTISLRPNSKFMEQVREENGELPPGVTAFEEVKVVFRKD